MSCAHGVCGSDGLTINGQAALACQKLVKDYDYTKEILVEPLRYFEVIKDLVVDLKPFFKRIKSINPQTPQEPVLIQKERTQTASEEKAGKIVCEPNFKGRLAGGLFSSIELHHGCEFSHSS
jgi:succinate dehydrogenase / fumarate reductase iron-sulfur subunit